MIRQLLKTDTLPMHLPLDADPSERLIQDYISRGTCYVMESAHEIIGIYVMIPTRPDTVEIVNVAVDESHQKKGYGRQLVNHSIAQAKAEGYRTVEIGTGNSSIHQLQLYQKCGFRIVGVDRDFFLRHYDEPIYENGIQTIDMIRLSQDI